MTQQTHPASSGVPTPDETSAPERAGDAGTPTASGGSIDRTPYTEPTRPALRASNPSQGYGFGTPEEAPGTQWFGAEGYGGHGSYPPSPARTAARAPKNRPGKGVVQLTAVALLAAALASGGTFAAARYGTPAQASSPVAATTTQSNGSSSPQVVQGSATAPDWTATAKAVAPSVVSITVASAQAQGQGSGVVLDAQGHILTNNHVATGAGTGATISVTLNDGRTYEWTFAHFVTLV